MNARDKAGNTPLIVAARDGRLTAVKELLKKGADVHAKNAFFRDALESAQVGGYQETVALLKAHGAQGITQKEISFSSKKERFSRVGWKCPAGGVIVSRFLKRQGKG